MSGDEAAIRALIMRRVAAIRAKNAAAAIETLADDVIAFELPPPLRLRPQQARDLAALQAWFDLWEGPVQIEIKELAVHAGGDVGFAHSLNRLGGIRRGGGAVDFWMRSTLGFRKSQGVWKIAHGHSSVPFAMDGSYRALLDLQP